MFLKISLRANAGVPKTHCETKTSPTFSVFPQNTLILTESRVEFSNLHSIFRLRALRYQVSLEEILGQAKLPTIMLVNCLVFFTVFFIPGHNCTPQTLLLISLDGFRWDFAGKA